jgi:hypothetical protein
MTHAAPGYAGQLLNNQTRFNSGFIIYIKNIRLNEIKHWSEKC